MYCRKLYRIMYSFFVLVSTILKTSYSFQYQSDTGQHCSEKNQNDCISDEKVWFECPITCSIFFHMEGSMKERREDPEAIFELSVIKQDGKMLPLENFEGSVILYAVLPMFPGMYAFYQQLLSHVQSVFPYTIETLIAPYIPQDDSEAYDIPPKRLQNSKTIQLKPIVSLELTPALKYLAEAPIVAGNDDTDMFLDRVTIYIISSDGMFIERLISPSVQLLERRVSVFLKQLEHFQKNSGYEL